MVQIARTVQAACKVAEFANSAPHDLHFTFGKDRYPREASVRRGARRTETCSIFDRTLG